MFFIILIQYIFPYRYTMARFEMNALVEKRNKLNGTVIVLRIA